MRVIEILHCEKIIMFNYQKNDYKYSFNCYYACLNLKNFSFALTILIKNVIDLVCFNKSG
jgi:hypothetical protein